MITLNKNLIYFCVLYCFILLIEHVHASPKKKNDSNDEDFMNSNLVKNNVSNPEAPLEYCSNTSRRPKRLAIQGQGHILFSNRIKNLHDALNIPNQNDYVREPLPPWNDKTYPFVEVIQRRDTNRIGFPISVPVYIKADILSSHVSYASNRSRPPIPQHIIDYLDLVGRYTGRVNNDPNADDAGHLLAQSLGGSTDDQFNFSPQTARLNRHAESNTYSIWLGEEKAMAKFLSDAPNRRIVWELLIRYPPRTSTGDYRLRPVEFCLRHTNFNEHKQEVDNRNNVLTHAFPVMCFSNHPDDECRYDEYE